MTYTTPHHHWLRNLFFLYLFYLLIRWFWRTTVSLVGMTFLFLAILVTTVIPPWRWKRADFIFDLRRLGIYFANTWAIKPMPVPGKGDQPSEYLRKHGMPPKADRSVIPPNDPRPFRGFGRTSEDIQPYTSFGYARNAEGNQPISRP